MPLERKDPGLDELRLRLLSSWVPSGFFTAVMSDLTVNGGVDALEGGVDVDEPATVTVVELPGPWEMRASLTALRAASSSTSSEPTSPLSSA